jgi:hypothetical protein
VEHVLRGVEKSLGTIADSSPIVTFANGQLLYPFHAEHADALQLRLHFERSKFFCQVLLQRSAVLPRVLQMVKHASSQGMGF